MPSRSALRVIQRHNDAQSNHAADNFTTKEEAILGAYRTLAEEMGAMLEVDLDGQIVLYTGYFKSDLHGVEDPKSPVEYIDLYCPKKYIEAREPTIEDLESEDFPPAVQLQWKKDAEVEAHYSNSTINKENK
tara:strand:+ start:101 stop:496 length:396 start_codon:yes stop_codon:yes gene_type:complete